MNIKKIVFCLSFIIVFTIFTIHAQNINWNLTGAGARAAGFGGAFIGLADDATAISWNPAGLTQLERAEGSIVSRFISDTYEYKLIGSEISLGSDHFILNFSSAVYPFQFSAQKIVTAIAYQRQLDLYTKWDLTESGGSEGEITGGANTLMMGLGVRIFPIVSVGVSSNIWMGTLNSEEIYEGDTWELEETFSGFNFTAGSMIDLSLLENPIPIKIGLAIKTPFDLEGDYGDATETIEMPLMLGAGTSFRLGENLTIACDYETRAYKDKKIIDSDGEEETLSYHNLNQIRVGGEYLLITDFAVIPLRAGFQTYPTTCSDLDDYWESTDKQVIGSGFSIGTGLIFEKFALDATFSMTSFKQKIGSAGDYSKVSSGIFTISGILYF